MIFRQYELGCLSLFSYLIGDETTGRAIVVDPQRDVRMVSVCKKITMVVQARFITTALPHT